MSIKKTHEAQNATPANAEVMMKRGVYTTPSVHYTESIVPVLSVNVKDKSHKPERNYANSPRISREYPLTSIFPRAKITPIWENVGGGALDAP